MNPALWAAKTGLDAQQTRLAVTSNNLANVSTSGFKKGRAVFEDLLYQNVRQVGGSTSQDTVAPSGVHLGTGVRVVATEKLYTQGGLTQTGNALDVAVEGRGFFQIQMPDGTTTYTRDGNFQLSAQGQMVTSSGYVLQPGISIPAGLQPLGENLLAETVASGPAQTGTPGQNGLGVTTQGSVEASNVNVVEELVNMIETQRAYEMNSKAISTADQMLEYVNNQL